MALLKGTNSYSTVAEAELYFEDRINATAWVNADDISKAQALIMATTMLDGLDWSGAATDSSQSLAFPRNVEYFDPRLGVTVSSADAIPDRIIKATFEQAIHLLNNDDLLDNTGLIKNLNVGSVALQTIRPASKIPLLVKKMIKPLLTNGNMSNSWWRAS